MDWHECLTLVGQLAPLPVNHEHSTVARSTPHRKQTVLGILNIQNILKPQLVIGVNCVSPSAYHGSPACCAIGVLNLGAVGQQSNVQDVMPEYWKRRPGADLVGRGSSARVTLYSA
jgi:hypothetical protein